MSCIVIADDHPLFRAAIRLALADLSGPEPEIEEASSFAALDKLLDRYGQAVALVLLDLKMPGMQGFDGLLDLRKRFSELPVVIVSATEEPALIRDALALGASGYVPKSLQRQEITAAIERVLAGEIFVPPQVETALAPDPVVDAVQALTPQQLKVLTLMVAGKPNKIIAYELGIAETTVKAHITVILRKLGVFSRTQAVIAAQRLLRPATG